MNSMPAKVRIVYAGHDFFSSCLAKLVTNEAVEVVMCLTSPPTGPVERIVQIAHEYQIPVFYGKPTKKIINLVNDFKADLIIAAAYLYRIPIERLAVGYAINVHPSLLPTGRGPNPLPYLAVEQSDACGITIHELTADFDSGPILLQQSIALDTGSEGLNELYLKLFAAAPRLVENFIANMTEIKAKKMEQGSGSYWPEYGVVARTVMAEKATVSDIYALSRKFGFIGIEIILRGGDAVSAMHVNATTCTHNFEVGSVVAELRQGTVVALVDGLALVS